MVRIINTQRSGKNLDEAFSVLGGPAFLHLSVITEFRLYQVVLRFYANGRECQRTKLQNIRTVHVTLRLLQHRLDIAHHRFQILALVQEHAVPVRYLILPVLLPFAQRIFL